MFKGVESVTMFSSDASKLAKFYKSKVGIDFGVEAELGDDGTTLFGYQSKEGASFYIVDHSEIEGQAKEPTRTIINFEVSDIEEDFDKLKQAGVKVVKEVYHVEDYGFIATFEDPDGNYFQIVKTSP